MSVATRSVSVDDRGRGARWHPEYIYNPTRESSWQQAASRPPKFQVKAAFPEKQVALQVPWLFQPPKFQVRGAQVAESAIRLPEAVLQV